MNIESLELELSKSLLNKKIIYFDTRFWIYMRDSILYPEEDRFREYSKLLKISESLVKNGRCVFPISEDIFMEVMKQTDKKTRKKTCEIIDKLSTGIALIDYDERVIFEAKELFKIPTEKIKSVWTKLAYMMKKIPIDYGNLILWDISLLELLETIDTFDKNPFMGNLKSSITKLTEDLNIEKGWYNGNFQEIFKIEVATIIKVDGEYFIRALNIESLNNQVIVQLMEVIYKFCISSKPENKTIIMPSLQVRAGLNAAIKLDKNRRFKQNDWHDINHAIAALVYADYFFTEKSLSHLIKSKPLSFDKVYNCVVESKVENVILLLQKLHNK
jgi:hypothetical protein